MHLASFNAYHAMKYLSALIAEVVRLLSVFIGRCYTPQGPANSLIARHTGPDTKPNSVTQNLILINFHFIARDCQSLLLLRTFGESGHLAKDAAHLTNLPNAQHLVNCTVQITNIYAALCVLDI